MVSEEGAVVTGVDVVGVVDLVETAALEVIEVDLGATEDMAVTEVEVGASVEALTEVTMVVSEEVSEEGETGIQVVPSGMCIFTNSTDQ